MGPTRERDNYIRSFPQSVGTSEIFNLQFTIFNLQFPPRSDALLGRPCRG